MQRDTHSAVADAFAQHPSAMKMVVAAFTGHCGLGGFTTRLIKNYIVDGSLSVGLTDLLYQGTCPGAWYLYLEEMTECALIKFADHT